MIAGGESHQEGKEAVAEGGWWSLERNFYIFFLVFIFFLFVTSKYRRYWRRERLCPLMGELDRLRLVVLLINQFVYLLLLFVGFVSYIEMGWNALAC